MSGKEMGTNDCTPKGRREDEFVTINVKKYDVKTDALINSMFMERTFLLRSDF